MDNVMREYIDSPDDLIVYFRPMKPSLVKKGFNSIKSWFNNHVSWG